MSYSKDKKSFDARAVLRSTYHQACHGPGDSRGGSVLLFRCCRGGRIRSPPPPCANTSHPAHHQAFLERGLASLPLPVEDEQQGDEGQSEQSEQQRLGNVRARRSATAAAGPAGPAPAPEPISLHTHDLVVGPGENQIYPSRLVTTSLDGASVNLGETGGVVALLKKEVP